MCALIKLSGKPLTKLIEVVSTGIGTLYRPRAIKKEADAKAYEIKVIEKAKSEALAEGKLIEADNLDRLNERLIAKELKRQNNIDDVVEVAAIQLKDKTQVSDDIVDEDWSTRFFNIVQNVSDDEMKDLWGRILAGEIEQPKSYSIRTLELLRNISKEEADLFVKVSQFVLKSGDYFLFEENNDNCPSKARVNFQDIALLTEIGLIRADSFVYKTYESMGKEEITHHIIYGNQIILFNSRHKVVGHQLMVNTLTRAGQELYNLIQVIPDMEYIKDIAVYLKSKNLIKVRYSYIEEISDSKIRYKNPVIDL